MAVSDGEDGPNGLEVERAGAGRRDGNFSDLNMERPRRPTRPPLATEPQKISKCAFCRKDHKKVRFSWDRDGEN
jgi:hypothetical protein